ncbi:MAG: phosphatase PAP2 family protein [Actinomycetota bacterium]
MEITDRFGERFRHHPPALFCAILVLLSFLGMTAVLVGVGLFITHGPMSGSIGRWDTHISTWLVVHRTSGLNTATVIGSGLGATAVIVGGELVAVIVLAIVRRWRDVGYLVTAVSLEAAVALTSSTLVDRPRPTVIRLDVVPPTKSFPSGHTAAAISLYIALAVLLTPHLRNRFLRTVIWAIVLLIPVVVGVSRVYRGMHYASDVLGSVLLGTLALWIAWVVVGCTASVWRHRHEPHQAPIFADPTGPMVEVGR